VEYSPTALHDDDWPTLISVGEHDTLKLVNNLGAAGGLSPLMSGGGPVSSAMTVTVADALLPP
jgi:hypothetical protein